MADKFVIASNNAHKIHEFKRILSTLGVEVLSAKEAGVDFSNVEETGETFAENARIKALYAFKECGLPSIADDSGLCVDALNGRPGIYSARYGGENSTDDEKIKLLLSELSNVELKDRTAHFICSICCVISENDIVTVEGKCQGFIGNQKKGKNGFGYDPVFYLDNGKSFAELDSAEKDLFSHRGNALRNFYTLLKERKDLYNVNQ
ncbi:MAG: RdgB/HAM1 family non-canonical purine NTP pyrophosphatase [Clostridia bacterium]|nr:RdgB/HAM1 family non-canonical purine NTP pyrophosphatase [Clostridia bacterium]